MTPEEERERVQAFLAALVAVEDGPFLSARVRELQEEIRYSRDHVPIDPDELRAKIKLLGGPTSASRYLGVERTTLRTWVKKGKIPVKAAARIALLIATGAPRLRKRPLMKNYG